MVAIWTSSYFTADSNRWLRVYDGCHNVFYFFKKKNRAERKGLLRESINAMYIGGIVRLTKRILLGTLLFEGIGAVLLSLRFIPKGLAGRYI